MSKVIWLSVGVMIVLGAPLAFADFVTQFSFNGAGITIDGTTQTVTTSGGASTGGSTITFGSNGSIEIGNLTVSPTGTTGGFNINVGGCPMCGAAMVGYGSSPPHIFEDLTGIRNQSGASGALTIITGATGFTSPTTDPWLVHSNVLAGDSLVGPNTVNFISFIDTTNTQFGTQQSILSSTMTMPSDSSQFAAQTVSTIPSATPYSLTESATVILGSGDVLSFLQSSTTVAVPESSAGLLLGIGLAGVVMWRCRTLALLKYP